VEEHILHGTKVKENLVDTSAPFFASQQKIVLENCGKINAESIEEYIAVAAMMPLQKYSASSSRLKLSRKSGRAVCVAEEGRISYGLKWGIVHKAKSEQKYIICNADEGDPGAFMDRSVLEGDPHRILEGMAIAGYAIGANQGFI